MSKTSVFFRVQELKNGMKVVSDVYKDGILIIKKGTILTEEIILRLKKAYCFEKIEISLPDEYRIQDTKEFEIEKAVETFKEISEGLEKIFENIDVFRESGIEEIRKFSKKIQDEINLSMMIITNIVFKGSAKYCIYRHAVHVATLSGLLGKWIGLDKAKINLLIYSALLHDFGMTKIDEKILANQKSLTHNEFKQIQEHTKIGYKYVNEIPYLDKSVSYGVLMHHERADGSGYPFGIKGEKIHDFAKIIAIADEFDAMNSDRAYRKKKGVFEVLEIMKEESLKKLDYNYCKIFLEHVSNYYIGEQVLLNTGEIAKVLQMNVNNLYRPLLLKDGEFIDLGNNKDVFVKELILK